MTGTLTRLKARSLLAECTGRDIWSLQYCQERRVPAVWLEELAECFESGFRADDQTIYEEGQVTNQYHGVRDVDLALKLAEFLGVRTEEVQLQAFGPVMLVAALKDAVDEV